MPEHALHDDAGVLLAVLGVQQDETREIVEDDRRMSEERGKVDDAVQVAADVREPQEPGLRERNGHDGRHRDHFPRIAEANQPALVAVASPNRDDSTCAAVFAARQVASSCWNDRRSTRAVRLMGRYVFGSGLASDGDLVEQFVSIHGLHDVVARPWRRPQILSVSWLLACT